MKRHETVKFTIPNFDQYNPRKDYKSIPWVRIDVGIFDDPKFACLSSVSMLLQLHLITLCGRENSGSTTFNVRLTSARLRLKPVTIKRAVDELEQFQLITDVLRSWDDRETFATKRTKRTKRNDTKRLQGGRSPNVTKSKSPPKTKHVWEAYCAAYRERYGVEPVRNATINGQLSQILKRLGEQDAPHVAMYYVSLNDAWYSKQGHSVGVLLRDCEKIRTLWATNKSTTAIDPKTAHWQDQWNRIQRGEL